MNDWEVFTVFINRNPALFKAMYTNQDESSVNEFFSELHPNT